MDSSAVDRDHALADYFKEADDYDSDDYASTTDPDSDAELSDFDDEGPTTPTSATTLPIAAATPAHARAPAPTRRLVEFCCGHASRIGQRAPAGCEVTRLTIDDDLTTQAGLEKAVEAVSHADVPTLLFGALPCTGGSPYQRMNWYRGAKTRKKIRKHWAIFRALWRNFKIVAETCIAQGGQVAIEWPRSCTYWRRPEVKACLIKWGCSPVHFDGCMYGLVSQQARTQGQPLRKPWTIASTTDAFQRLRRKCNGAHSHARIEGSDTRITESYTDDLADAVHDCWAHHCNDHAHGHRSTQAAP